MNISDTLHGFRVVNKRPVPGMSATLYELVYEKNGASLIYLERPDENKTFAITFQTIPEDDSGVFHILEHSVLCGSAKYPIKEPFVELLKGSMQTFLNAFTFPDKTMYPVCSRNGQDFLNLIDVYMDAVLHPAITAEERIFLQEGWHYEWAPGETLPHATGVVLNEMKGAYASVDEVIGEQMTKLLYPDTCYGHDSGGEPGAVVKLTYERFLQAHQTYYHPSAAKIFLDGEMDLSAVLARLDAFLSPYDPRPVTCTIPYQAPVCPPRMYGTYEISEEEDPTGKARLCFGYIGFPYDQKEQLLAMNILFEVLAGSNEAPLKKALLEGGLCEDVSLTSYDGVKQSAAMLEVRGVKEEDVPAIEKTIHQVFLSAAEGGLPKKRLVAALNSLEFRLREKDFGSYPIGLIHCFNVMESWLYGGDPMQNLHYDEALQFLRQALQTDFYADIVRRVFLDTNHHASLLLRPDASHGERVRMAEAQRIAALAAGWDTATEAALRQKSAELLAWQQAEEDPTAAACLPHLHVSDIDPLPRQTPEEQYRLDGVPVYHHPLDTGKIAYTDLYFQVADATKEELSALSFLTSLLGKLDTDEHSALDLQTELSTHLGSLYFAPDVFGYRTDLTVARPYLRVSISVLDSEKAAVAPLLSEIMYHTLFDSKERIQNLLRQSKHALRESYPASGHSMAMQRTSAYLSAVGAVKECFGSVGYYRYLETLHTQLQQQPEAVFAQLSDLAGKYFTRARLCISFTGPRDDFYLLSLLHTMPQGSAPASDRSAIQALGARREGIEIPADTSFAVRAMAFSEALDGAGVVAKTVLGLDYLWNTVRVQGGAYGGGLVLRKNNMGFFYSYRDPGAAASLEAFIGSLAYLRDYKQRCGADIEKYIIGAIGAYESVRSARAMGDMAFAETFSGFTYEDACLLRRRILAADVDALARFADALEQALQPEAVCVVGSKELLARCLQEGKIDTIIRLN